jgi:hypothetical protein
MSLPSRLRGASLRSAGILPVPGTARKRPRGMAVVSFGLWPAFAVGAAVRSAPAVSRSPAMGSLACPPAIFLRAHLFAGRASVRSLVPYSAQAGLATSPRSLASYLTPRQPLRAEKAGGPGGFAAPRLGWLRMRPAQGRCAGVDVYAGCSYAGLPPRPHTCAALTGCVFFAPCDPGAATADWRAWYAAGLGWLCAARWQPRPFGSSPSVGSVGPGAAAAEQARILPASPGAHILATSPKVAHAAPERLYLGAQTDQQRR